MNHFDELEYNLIFPNGSPPKCIDKVGEVILLKLLDLTSVHRISTKNSLNEFLTRLFISIDLPLNHFIDNYFKDNGIFQIVTPKGKLLINLDLLIELIGLSTSLSATFNYIGTTEEFKYHNHIKEWPRNFSPRLKNSLKNLEDKEIQNARIVAQFFTDKIDDRFFFSEDSHIQSYQFCRLETCFDCMEINKAVIYKPFNTLPIQSINYIRNSIGNKKLDCSKNFIVETTLDERIEDIIKIAYGIKNGFIDWNGYMLEYHRYVDPYYFISFTSIMDVFLNSKTFMDLYHYWNMYEWIDLLPNHE